jgi:hypothetical protein
MPDIPTLSESLRTKEFPNAAREILPNDRTAYAISRFEGESNTTPSSKHVPEVSHPQSGLAA